MIQASPGVFVQLKNGVWMSLSFSLLIWVMCSFSGNSLFVYVKLYQDSVCVMSPVAFV